MAMRKWTTISTKKFSDTLEFWKNFLASLAFSTTIATSAIAIINTWCWVETVNQKTWETRNFILEKWKSTTETFELAPWNYTVTVYLEWDPALYVETFKYDELLDSWVIDKSYWKIEIFSVNNDEWYITLKVTIYNQDYQDKAVKWEIQVKYNWDI